MLLINLAIPIYNEELILAENTKKILDYLSDHNNLGFDWQIILADNASTDQTPIIGKKLAQQFPDKIKYLRLEQKGKGLAVKTAWQLFPANYYLFMDADLSTDLEALPRLLDELKNGVDVAIGSRYLPGSKINRSLLRTFISKTLRLIINTWLKLPLTDLPCGFKGVSRKIVDVLLPQVKNNEWFFDTELLYLAYQQKYNIKEIPVNWQETHNQKRKSRVGIFQVSWNYLKEIYKLKNLP